MRRVSAWAMLAPVQSLTITLRIGLAGESTTAHPTGDATDPNGVTRHFVGWMGLVAAIDELLSGAPAGDPAGPDGDDP